MENGYVESFNGKFREECLNQNRFQDISEAKIIVEEWRKDYNNNRSHSTPGYLTPKEYLKRKKEEETEKVYLCIGEIWVGLTLFCKGSYSNLFGSTGRI